MSKNLWNAPKSVATGRGPSVDSSSELLQEGDLRVRGVIYCTSQDGLQSLAITPTSIAASSQVSLSSQMQGYDDTVTASSQNAVKSSGVWSWVRSLLTYDTSIATGSLSTNPPTSRAVSTFVSNQLTALQAAYDSAISASSTSTAAPRTSAVASFVTSQITAFRNALDSAITLTSTNAPRSSAVASYVNFQIANLPNQYDATVTASSTNAVRSSGIFSAIQSAVASASAVPTGTILMWSANNVPSGFLLCNGQTVSATTFSALFAVIGTTYGGTSTNFALPNLVSRFPMGSASFVGQTGGNASITLQVGQLPPHAHEINDPMHSHQTSIQKAGWSGSSRIVWTDDWHTGLNMPSTFTSGAARTGITIRNTGNGDPINIIPPFLTVFYVIKT